MIKALDYFVISVWRRDGERFIEVMRDYPDYFEEVERTKAEQGKVKKLAK